MFRKNNKKQQWQNVKENQNQNRLQQRSKNNLLHQVWTKMNQHLVQTLCKPTQVAVSYPKASNSFVLYSSHTVLYNIYAILHFIISACYIISIFKIERSHNLDRSFRNSYIIPSFPTREQHAHSVQNARSRFNKLNQSYSC